VTMVTPSFLFADWRGVLRKTYLRHFVDGAAI
jgi:hypothetical protein